MVSVIILLENRKMEKERILQRGYVSKHLELHIIPIAIKQKTNLIKINIQLMNVDVNIQFVVYIDFVIDHVSTAKHNLQYNSQV